METHTSEPVYLKIKAGSLLLLHVTLQQKTSLHTVMCQSVRVSLDGKKYFIVFVLLHFFDLVILRMNSVFLMGSVQQDSSEKNVTCHNEQYVELIISIFKTFIKPVKMS